MLWRFIHLAFKGAYFGYSWSTEVVFNGLRESDKALNIRWMLVL